MTSPACRKKKQKSKASSESGSGSQKNDTKKQDDSQSKKDQSSTTRSETLKQNNADQHENMTSLCEAVCQENYDVAGHLIDACSTPGLIAFIKDNLENLSNSKQVLDEMTLYSQLVAISLAVVTVEGRGQTDVIGQDDLRQLVGVIQKTETKKTFAASCLLLTLTLWRENHGDVRKTTELTGSKISEAGLKGELVDFFIRNQGMEVLKSKLTTLPHSQIGESDVIWKCLPLIVMSTSNAGRNWLHKNWSELSLHDSLLHKIPSHSDMITVHFPALGHVIQSVARSLNNGPDVQNEKVKELVDESNTVKRKKKSHARKYMRIDREVAGDGSSDEGIEGDAIGCDGFRRVQTHGKRSVSKNQPEVCEGFPLEQDVTRLLDSSDVMTSQAGQDVKTVTGVTSLSVHDGKLVPCVESVWGQVVTSMPVAGRGNREEFPPISRGEDLQVHQNDDTNDDDGWVKVESRRQTPKAGGCGVQVPPAAPRQPPASVSSQNLVLSYAGAARTSYCTTAESTSARTGPMRWADVAKIGCPPRDTGDRCFTAGERSFTTGDRSFSMLLGDSRFPAVGEGSKISGLCKPHDYQDNRSLYTESQVFKDQKAPDDSIGLDWFRIAKSVAKMEDDDVTQLDESDSDTSAGSSSSSESLAKTSSSSTTINAVKAVVKVKVNRVGGANSGVTTPLCGKRGYEEMSGLLSYSQVCGSTGSGEAGQVCGSTSQVTAPTCSAGDFTRDVKASFASVTKARSDDNALFQCLRPTGGADSPLGNPFSTSVKPDTALGRSFGNYFTPNYQKPDVMSVDVPKEHAGTKFMASLLSTEMAPVNWTGEDKLWGVRRQGTSGKGGETTVFLPTDTPAMDESAPLGWDDSLRYMPSLSGMSSLMDGNPLMATSSDKKPPTSATSPPHNATSNPSQTQSGPSTPPGFGKESTVVTSTTLWGQTTCSTDKGVPAVGCVDPVSQSSTSQQQLGHTSQSQAYTSCTGTMGDVYSTTLSWANRTRVTAAHITLTSDLSDVTGRTERQQVELQQLRQQQQQHLSVSHHDQQQQQLEQQMQQQQHNHQQQQQKQQQEQQQQQLHLQHQQHQQQLQQQQQHHQQQLHQQQLHQQQQLPVILSQQNIRLPHQQMFSPQQPLQLYQILRDPATPKMLTPDPKRRDLGRDLGFQQRKAQLSVNRMQYNTSMWMIRQQQPQHQQQHHQHHSHNHHHHHHQQQQQQQQQFQQHLVFPGHRTAKPRPPVERAVRPDSPPVLFPSDLRGEEPGFPGDRSGFPSLCDVRGGDVRGNELLSDVMVDPAFMERVALEQIHLQFVHLRETVHDASVSALRDSVFADDLDYYASLYRAKVRDVLCPGRGHDGEGVVPSFMGELRGGLFAPADNPEVMPTSQEKDRPRYSRRWRDDINKILTSLWTARIQHGNIVLPANPVDVRYGQGEFPLVLGLTTEASEVAVLVLDKSHAYIDPWLLSIMSDPELDKHFILKCKGCSETAVHEYVALELCDYTLGEYVDIVRPSYRQDPHSTARLAWQLLEGLRFLHRHLGMPHGCLRPSWIFVDAERGLRLGGYGIISRQRKDEGRPVCWTCVENLVNEANEPTLAGDIQVAGMLVYYILTGGRHPFGASTLEAEVNLMRAEVTATRPTPQLDHISDEANDLVGGMLAPDPATRPRVEQCLKHPFYWSSEKKFRLILIVGSDVLTEMKTGVALTGTGAPTMMEILTAVDICDVSLNWVQDILPNVMKEMRSFRVYRNTLAELTLFIYNCCLHFDKMTVGARELLGDPCKYFQGMFPNLFMAIYRSLAVSDRVDRACYKPFF